MLFNEILSGVTELSELFTVVTEALTKVLQRKIVCKGHTVNTVNTINELPAVSAADLKLRQMEPCAFCKERIIKLVSITVF